MNCLPYGPLRRRKSGSPWWRGEGRTSVPCSLLLFKLKWASERSKSQPGSESLTFHSLLQGFIFSPRYVCVCVCEKSQSYIKVYRKATFLLDSPVDVLPHLLISCSSFPHTLHTYSHVFSFPKLFESKFHIQWHSFPYIYFFNLINIQILFCVNGILLSSQNKEQ